MSAAAQSAVKRRLLIYFSYLGTNYQGLQRQRVYDKTPDLETVQGILEHGLSKVLRKQETPIRISSRTDAGVHALMSTAQFDIFSENLAYLGPERLCQSLNFFLDKNNTEIRVLKVNEVDPSFSVRKAHSRTYCFRIAVLKHNDYSGCVNSIRLSSTLPLLYLNRCQVVPQPFNYSDASAACKLFLGTWNFRSFMKSSPEDKEREESDYIKTIKRFSISKIYDGADLNYFDPRTANFIFYDFNIEGSGFLRRQVRKMVGSVLAVAAGKIGPQEIIDLLVVANPSKWNQKCTAANSEGLFLKCIEYKNLEVLRGEL